MPKLLVFAACEKVLIDKSANLISMISVLHGLTINISANQDEQFPPNVAFPFNWGIGTVWLKSPGEEEKKFEQRIDILFPDGSIAFQPNPISFQMTKRSHQIAMSINSFPLGVPGEYKILLYLREFGIDANWEVISEYPLEIKHDAIQQNR